MLEPEERSILLRLARQAVTLAAEDRPLPPVVIDDPSDSLQEPGCAFVTLTRLGALRGCIGALEANRPLAADVWEHAYAAAREDPRFVPVRPDELPEVHIEVSRLTDPKAVDVAPAMRSAALRPGIDGVILRRGMLRATYLPQVWEKVPDPVEFLEMLCEKAGLPRSAWRQDDVEMLVYQVESFEEAPHAAAAEDRLP